MLRRAIVTLLTGLCVFASSSLQAIGCDYDGDAWVTLGYRYDHFRWSIAGPDKVPNILSEIEWEYLGILEASAFGWNSFPCGLYYRWNTSYGAVVSGEVVDSDYLGDDRTFLFSKSKSRANIGNTFDAAAGAGWQFSFCNDGLLVAAVAGWAFDLQDMHLIKGRIVFDGINPANVGPLPNLHSKYEARWYGPWVGVDAVWQACPEWVFNGSFEYHHVRYRGTGDWNLRTDFDGSFHHASRGHGILGRLGILYAFRGDWLFILNLQGQRWEAFGGTDTTRIKQIVIDPATGIFLEQSVKVVLPFREAQWWSLGASFGVEYRY